MKSHEEEKADATVTTPNRTYPCSSVPHIFVTVNQMMIAICKALEVKTSTYPFGTLDSVASSLAATFYYKLIVIVTTSWISCQLRVIYPYAGDTAMMLHINKMLR